MSCSVDYELEVVMLRHISLHVSGEGLLWTSSSGVKLTVQEVKCRCCESLLSVAASPVPRHCCLKWVGLDSQLYIRGSDVKT